ncbi:unnamed protein product [Caenorhabditis bovis]|uniref:Uncharacterized protein n=1 Tax=Caenorhabditis bovis TaxID=2654633 RepID=A0A8S1F9N6_9PELO|nr:unnamed protein product [Caenorhabditis bovis]
MALIRARNNGNDELFGNEKSVTTICVHSIRYSTLAIMGSRAGSCCSMFSEMFDEPRQMTPEEVEKAAVFLGTQPARPVLGEVVQFFNELLQGDGFNVEIEPRISNPYFFVNLSIEDIMLMPNGVRCDAHGIWELLCFRRMNTLNARVQLPHYVYCCPWMYQKEVDDYTLFHHYQADLIAGASKKFKAFSLCRGSDKTFFDGVRRLVQEAHRDRVTNNFLIDNDLFDDFN